MQKMAAYKRVSTREQAEGNYSLEMQEDKVRNYCQLMDFELIELFEDAGHSGTNMRREALQNLIESIKKHRFDGVLVYKLDRLSRSQKDALYLIEDIFLKYNVAIVSVMETFDTSTAFGRASIGMLAVFAQLEVEQIKERMILGKVGRMKKGKAAAWVTPPFGYTYKDGQLFVDSLQATVVKSIFVDYMNGLSINKIRQRLNDEGDLGKKYPWRYDTVRAVLSNVTYTGLNRFKGVDYQGKHEALVGKTVFDAVQIELDRRQKEAYSKSGNNRPFQAKYLLSGLLYCGYCGASFELLQRCKRKDGTRKKVYGCLSKQSIKHNTAMMRRQEGCIAINYPIEQLEAEVLNRLEELRLNQDFFVNEKDEPNSLNKSIIEQRIAELRLQLKKLLALYLANKFPADLLDEQQATITQEITSLEKQLKPVLKKSKFDFLSTLTSIHQDIRSLDYESQKRILRSLVKKITLTGEKIHFHLVYE